MNDTRKTRVKHEKFASFDENIKNVNKEMGRDIAGWIQLALGTIWRGVLVIAIKILSTP